VCLWGVTELYTYGVGDLQMGFRAEVEDFQPYYAFHPSPKKLINLRIGASVLEETLDKMEKAREQAKLNRVDPKAAAREIALKVCIIAWAPPLRLRRGTSLHHRGGNLCISFSELSFLIG